MKRSLFGIISAATAVLPLIVTSCEAQFPETNKIEKKEVKIYNPAPMEVPNELVPGAFLNPKRYDELKEEQSKLEYHFERDNLIVSTLNGFLRFQIPNFLIRQGLTVKTVMDFIRDAIRYINFSPIVHEVSPYNFEVLTSGDLNYTLVSLLPNNMSWLIWNDVDFKHSRREDGAKRLVFHEFNHAMFANSRKMIYKNNLVPWLQEMKADTDVPFTNLNTYFYTTNRYELNLFNGLKNNWMPSYQHEKFNYDGDWYLDTISKVKGQYLLDGTFYSMVSEFSGHVYNGFFNSIKNEGSLPEIARLRFVANNYTWFDVDKPRQAYDIMKAWAKNTLNLGKGNNVRVLFAENGEIWSVDFVSFGTPESEKIKKIVIYDTSTNQIVYQKNVNVEWFPFGFKRHPLADCEYKYVVPSSYLFDDVKQKITIAPEHLLVKAFDANDKEMPINYFATMNFEKHFNPKTNKYEELKTSDLY